MSKRDNQIRNKRLKKDTKFINQKVNKQRKLSKVNVIKFNTREERKLLEAIKASIEV